MDAVLAVVMSVTGWSFVFDAYQQRTPGEKPTVWLRRHLDVNNWSWWVAAMASATFAVLGLIRVADGQWWGLALALPTAAMALVAVRRIKDVPTNRL